MLFNSIPFFLFFSVFLIIYFVVIPGRYRSFLLLIGSYVFYMTYEPIYVLLMATTTIVSFYCALKLSQQQNVSRKRTLLIFILLFCIGNLVFFKYFNFLNENFSLLFSWLKIPYSVPYIDILLPVGISFFTFETIGYVLDVYYEIRSPEKRLDKYALFISYFPKLLAGPIERSTTLLPQFYEKIKFNYVKFGWGLKLFLFGVFKKMVIADHLSLLVNPIYDAPASYDAITIILATYLFAFQMYCDFSGYTDMAMGISKMIGFELMDNFNHPYISKNVTEFWRRWHMSLSTWLRDYLYTPIMYSKKQWGVGALIYASFVTFILCGLWHGPKWTFVVFGLLQGTAIAFEVLTKKQRSFISRKIPSWIYNNLSILITFHFTVFCFIFFRANTFSDAVVILNKLSHFNLNSLSFMKYINTIGIGTFLFTIFTLICFLVIDQPLAKHIKKEIYYNKYMEPMVYSLLFASILLFSYYGKIEFIYFHF